VLFVVPGVPLVFPGRVVAEHVRQDVAAQRGGRLGLYPKPAVGYQHIRADGDVSSVHATRGAQRVVSIERARGLRSYIGVIQLVDRDVGEPDPRHPELRSCRQLEPGCDPRSARGAQGR